MTAPTTVTAWLDEAQARLPHGLAECDLSNRERDALTAIAALRAVESVIGAYQQALDEDGDLVALDRRRATEEILGDLHKEIAAALRVQP